MKIQVLGSGCATCKKLFAMTKDAVKQLNLNVDVEYNTDISKIIEMGVMSSPVLAVNGKPAMVGFVPNIEKIKKLLSASSLNKEGALCSGNVSDNCRDECGSNDDCHCCTEK
ncbi:thioredoxin family protein [Candidatus Woesebacteria bacterium]|nr:thioredoxin family protein [Candidatus Woesebacteria bacterium]